VRRLAVAGAVLVAASTALAGPRPTPKIDLMRAFHAQLPKLHRMTTVPILLPRELPVLARPRHVYATGSATRNSFDLELGAVPRCGGANACFVAAFQGRLGARLPGKANLHLKAGDPALYHPISCGASCAPASLWFVHGGILYSWQVKEPPKQAKKVLVRLADEAIAAGPR
jgi:hypothetical protein